MSLPNYTEDKIQTTITSSDVNSKTVDELNAILSELSEEALDNIPNEIIDQLRIKSNPYGRTVEGSGKVLTYSFVDLSRKYMEKFLMTSMVSFLNRANDEWGVPSGVPVVAVSDYNKNNLLINPPLDEDGNIKIKGPALLDYENNVKFMEKRCIVKEFLAHAFQFDPEQHVRSAYRPNPDDESRDVLETPAAKLATIRAEKKSAKLKEKLRITNARRVARGKKAVENLPKITHSKKVTTPLEGIKDIPMTPLTNSLYTNGEDDDYKVRLTKATKDPTLIQTSTNMIPPEDLFHRFRYYVDVNYEEIQKVTNDLYCEKGDFETAVNPYEFHKNDEDADKFINKHKNEVIAKIWKAVSGKWNIISSRKAVRRGMTFKNEKTIILEEIMAQHERDSRIGASLMQKRIQMKKKKNIEEDGEDSEAFIKWKRNNSTLKELKSHYNEQSHASEDCPDDGIQVDYHIHNPKTGQFDTDHFFSQSEAPDFLEDSSPTGVPPSESK